MLNLIFRFVSVTNYKVGLEMTHLDLRMHSQPPAMQWDTARPARNVGVRCMVNARSLIHGLFEINLRLRWIDVSQGLAANVRRLTTGGWAFLCRDSR